MNIRTLLGAVIFGVIGGYAYFKAGDYQVGGANVFPQLVAGGMVLCSVLLLLVGFLRRAAPVRSEDALEEGLDHVGARMIWVILISVLFVVLIPMIGFRTASFLLILVGCWCFGLRRPVPVLAGAIGFAVLVPWAFVHFLHVRLPPELWNLVIAGP